jgi:hypothetical protein
MEVETQLQIAENLGYLKKGNHAYPSTRLCGSRPNPERIAGLRIEAGRRVELAAGNWKLAAVFYADH